MWPTTSWTIRVIQSTFVFALFFFYYLVCFLCVLMVLSQAWSRQSFSATNLLSCFPYNMKNWSSGMHAVWLWLIAESDDWRTSALVWHRVSSREFLHTCFTEGKTFRGEDKPPARWLKNSGDRDQHIFQGKSSYGWAGVWRRWDT